MMTLRQTHTRPPIFYVHSERDLDRTDAASCYGLAAGYLSARELTPDQKEIWKDLFQRRWVDACLKLAEGLKLIQVDAVAIVPCSRADVVCGMRQAFSVVGLEELPNLIRKSNSSASFGGQSADYIAKNLSVHLNCGSLRRATKIAICDDFASTGRTLCGLHDALSRDPMFADRQILLAAVGAAS